jgi:CRISPR-associated endonuclease/helicase Cas3
VSCPSLSSIITGESCFLISTQVVEAGVDIDFPRVYRQLAPLDSLVQAAGRCNRKGVKSKDKSIVTVFRMSAIDPPGYEVGVPITRGILNRFDLNENLLEAIEHYFVTYFHENIDGGKEIVSLRNAYNFPEVAKRVSVIDDLNQISVVVDWGDGKTIVENLKNKDFMNEYDWRQLQSFTVNIRVKKEKLIEEDESLIKKLSNGLNIWVGNYDECGIMTPAES